MGEKKEVLLANVDGSKEKVGGLFGKISSVAGAYVEALQGNTNKVKKSFRDNKQHVLNVNLRHAVIAGDVLSAESFILQGANVNSINNIEKGGNTPLHFAAASGNVEMCRLLIEKGANVDLKSAGGNAWTPIQVAAANLKSGVFDLLVKNKADIHVTHKDGSSLAESSLLVLASSAAAAKAKELEEVKGLKGDKLSTGNELGDAYAPYLAEGRRISDLYKGAMVEWDKSMNAGALAAQPGMGSGVRGLPGQLSSVAGGIVNAEVAAMDVFESEVAKNTKSGDLAKRIRGINTSDTQNYATHKTGVGHRAVNKGRNTSVGDLFSNRSTSTVDAVQEQTTKFVDAASIAVATVAETIEKASGSFRAAVGGSKRGSKGYAKVGGDDTQSLLGDGEHKKGSFRDRVSKATGNGVTPTYKLI